MRLPLLIAAITLAAAAPAQAVYHAGTETTTSGAVTATLAWDEGTDGPVNLRLAINRAGVTAFQQPIPRVCDEDCGRWANDDDYFKIVDFEGDGEPEVFVRTFRWSDCCEVFGIYSRDAVTGNYTEFTMELETDIEAEDLDRDGDAELVTHDVAMSLGGGSRTPRRVLAYSPTAGLRDVTREHPKVIREDAGFARDAVRGLTPNDSSARSALTTYVADQYLLGKGPAALKLLDRQLARGVVGTPKESRAYRRKLLALLERRGYR
jgi:hypothetical protein